MPMGGILALKGIEGAMVILHGSQGCSTYMRRSIAEHFNEPVDVGSSSLNEKGTVYGGQKQLKQAIDNVRRIYRPQLVGILTTCLAETIGEDVRRIAEEYRVEHKLEECLLVAAATPGYGGSHSEGYWYTLRRTVEQLAGPAVKHRGVNLIVPHSLSAADIRELKRLMAMMQVPYMLLPDVSDTLDRPFEAAYTKLPPGGTPISAIQRMAGATATIELGGPGDEKLLPGKYLAEAYDVPYYRLPVPYGLENTDRLIALLKEISGQPVPTELLQERGRLMDAMIDAHKHTFQGRTALYGDLDMVHGLAGFCAENGMFPRVVATGSRNSAWCNDLRERLAASPETVAILDEGDFSMVRAHSEQVGVNLAVGHSEGKYLEEKADIPVVRMGFPIHDRLGGQRILSVGYTGSALLLDRMANTLLERKYRSYRGDLYKKFYSHGQGQGMAKSTQAAQDRGGESA